MDLLGHRFLIPQALQPQRSARAPAGRIQDQIAGDELLRAGAATTFAAVLARAAALAVRLEPHPDDAAPVGGSDQIGDVVPVDEGHPGQRAHTSTHVAFQQRAPGEQHRLPDRGPADAVPGQKPPHVAQQVAHRSPCGDDLLGQSRKQAVQRPPAAGQQHVHVPSLRHTSPLLRLGREHVPLHDRDAIERFGQRAGGQQSRHARAEHDSMLPHGTRHSVTPEVRRLDRFGRQQANCPAREFRSFLRACRFTATSGERGQSGLCPRAGREPARDSLRSVRGELRPPETGGCRKTKR